MINGFIDVDAVEETEKDTRSQSQKEAEEDLQWVKDKLHALWGSEQTMSEYIRQDYVAARDGTREFNTEDLELPNSMPVTAVPGESMTQPANKPWDTPPEIVSMKELFKKIEKQATRNEVKLLNLIRTIDAGVPTEILAKGVTFKYFLEGKITPDLAMSSIPYVSLYFAGLAMKLGEEAPHIIATLDTERMPTATEDKLAKVLRPAKYKRDLGNTQLREIKGQMPVQPMESQETMEPPPEQQLNFMNVEEQ